MILAIGDTITIFQHHIYRSDLIILDIAANNPNRPIYISSRSQNQSAVFLSRYLKNQGLTSCFDFNRNSSKNLFRVSELIKDWRLNGYNSKLTYIDYEAQKIGRYYVNSIALHIEELVEQGKTKKAGELALLCTTTFPVKTTSFRGYTDAIRTLKGLYAAQLNSEATEYSEELVYRLMQEANYYQSLKNTIADYSGRKEFRKVEIALQKLKALLITHQQNQKAMEIEKFLAFFAKNKK